MRGHGERSLWPRRFRLPWLLVNDEQPDETSDTTGANERPRSLVQRLVGWVAEGAIIIVGAVIIAALLRTFVAQMFVIPSGSMEHTIEVGDRVVVSKFGGFQRGDVVVFRDPGGWLNIEKQEPGPVQQALEFVGILPNSGQDHLIKRVIGLPGDHVRLGDDGRIEINGVSIDESAYLYAQDGVQVAAATVPFDIVVPKDRLFVMGDHRNSSGDSRCRLANVTQGEAPGSAAFVPVDHVVGAAVAIVAPLDRLATFNVPLVFAQVPAPAEPAPDRPVLNHVEPGC